MTLIDALLWSQVLLWVVVVAMAFLLFALMRQIGALHDRVAPVGALTLAGGLKPGEAIPAMVVHDLFGEPVPVSGTSPDGRARLLVFTAPNCPVCRELKETLAVIARQERRWLAVIQVSDGDPAEHRAAAEEARAAGMRYVLSRNLGVLLEVSRLPTAALVDEKGVLIAKGLVNSREHLESLFEARRQGHASLQDFLKGRRPDGSPSAMTQDGERERHHA
ncbi:MAG: hypothetical protein KatS3mg119_1269 [Rhodothalassiaceae bacterium]|nr:MAG: hypothetical protein KatS3mg119_1269 [Rhodothalassiaceae bacterium]